MRELAEALKGTPGLRMRQGVVTAVSGSTNSVLIGGSDVPVDDVQHLNSCAPQVGDVVWVASDGADLWIIGTHGDPPPIDPSRLPAFATYFAAAETAGDPAPVTGLAGAAAMTGVMLSWDLPPEALWRTWEVYEGTTAGFTPGTPILETTSSVVTIAHDPASGPWYFKVRAVNSRGEASSFVEVGPFTLADLPDVELGPGSVHAENMAANAVDLASAVVTGQLLAAKLADNAVTQAKIAGGAIDSTKLATAVNTAIATAQETAADGVADAATAAAAASAAATAASTADGKAVTALANAAAANTAASTADGKAVAAQADADQALSDAATAAGTADAALTAANGKNKVVFSTSDASGTAYATGDIWFKKSGSLIVAQWEFVAGAWSARTLDNAVIANLDAGKLTAGSISADRIAAGSILAAKLDVADVQAAVVTAAKVNALAISAGAITVGTLSADRIGANSIAAGKLDVGSVQAAVVTAAVVNALAIDAGAITAGTLNALRIGAGSITAAKLDVADVQAAVVTAAKVNTLALSAGAITTGTMDADRIAAGTIQAVHCDVTDLQANVVTAAKVNTLALSAGVIQSGTIATARLNATEIQTAVVTAAKINALTLNAVSITGGSIAGVSITGQTITGGTIRTGSGGTRIELTEAGQDTLSLYASGFVVPAELVIGGAGMTHGSAWMGLSITGPLAASANNPYGIILQQRYGVTNPYTGYETEITAIADSLSLIAGIAGVTLEAPMMGVGCKLIVGTASGNNRFDGPLYVFYGGIRPGTNWSSGVSDDGIWIQDSVSTARRWKLYYKSDTWTMQLRYDGNTYANFVATNHYNH